MSDGENNTGTGTGPAENKPVGFDLEPKKGEQQKTTPPADKGGGQAGDGTPDDVDRRYTKKEVSEIVKTRLGEDRSRKIIEKMSKQTGLSVEQLEAKIEEFDRQQVDQHIKDQAKKAGVDPALLSAIANQHAELSDIKMTMELQNMLGDPESYPGLKSFKDDVIEEAQSLGIPLKKAYFIVAGSKDNIKQIQREAEQRVVNNRQKRAGKDRVQGDSSSGVGDEPEYSDADIAAAKKVHMDVEEYVAVRDSDNIDRYREYKRKKNQK
jgi:hypothetical protein